jgi:tRNA(adenine34) deaminase
VTEHDDERMRLAIDEARAALAHDDVPVGAVLMDADGRVIGRVKNWQEECANPTSHAELEALREGARERGLWRLDGSVLYVTLEPCAMCAGALVNARVEGLVYGARDPRAGAVESLYQVCTDPRLNHRLVVRGGVLEEECAQLLRDFFRRKRA